ncbi:unnamed protein product [Pseudo-nitzschia multistriata]|uniref:Carboxypeptidase n=1 Tax=Pseudo-nitzschia multistriata TaxID=183589 RepID=A0A448Z901_9STRA|nr:unnamed protein product [Pseudo-nitzschia multistriata]
MSGAPRLPSICVGVLVRSLLLLLFLSLSIFRVDGRRRNPTLESSNPSETAGRRLTESNDESEGATTTSALLRHVSNDDGSSRSLIGTNVDVPKATTPDDHLVTNLPLLKDFEAKHWAGLLPVNDKGDGYLFYWLFAPDPKVLQEEKDRGRVKQDESNVPLVLWLNGGPACSSMDGLWLENGPFRLDTGNGNGEWGNIKLDPHSWHHAPAYVLYVDQPVGTGLAFTTSGNYPNNDQRVNEDFYYFLTEFMKLHGPNLNVQKNSDGLLTLGRPFFFSGESHAGHYIPSMMNYIRKQNANPKTLKQRQNGGVVMPLSGALIGNGWFDPVYQYSAHEAAYGYGLIGKAQKRSLALAEEKCQADLRKGRYTSGACFGLLEKVVSNSLGKGNDFVVSQYDQRVWEKRRFARDFPPGHKEVEAFLGRTHIVANAPIESVLSAIHAMPSWESGQRYRECTDPPYNALKHQDGLGVVGDIVEVLEDDTQKTRLLFFNGVHDLICNHVGNENALEALPWKYRAEYINAERYGWNAASTNKLGGYMKEFQNLGFLKVLDSGHMVPMDVPSIALDMVRAFVYHEPFNTFRQDINPVSESEVPQNSNGCNDCPVCEECTMQTCEERFQVSKGSSMLSGIGWGVTAFCAMAGCYCLYFYGSKLLCRRRRQKYYSDASGTVELSASSAASNGGYSDVDNDVASESDGLFYGDNEEFEDQKIDLSDPSFGGSDDDSTRRRVRGLS